MIMLAFLAGCLCGIIFLSIIGYIRSKNINELKRYLTLTIYDKQTVIILQDNEGEILGNECWPTDNIAIVYNTNRKIDAT